MSIKLFNKQSKGIGLLLFLAFFSFLSCRSSTLDESETISLEEKKRLLSKKINRIYLAFRDSTANNLPFGISLPKSSELIDSKLDSLFNGFIKLMPFFYVKGEQQSAIADQKWPARYSKHVFKENHTSTSSNAPIFHVNKDPKFDSAEKDSINFSIVGCHNEDYFEEKSEDELGNLSKRPYYKRASEDVANLGYPSTPIFLGPMGSLNFNERIRIADFPIVSNTQENIKDQECKVIGPDASYNAANYLNTMKDFSNTLGPKSLDYLATGISTMVCAAFVAGPVIGAVGAAGTGVVKALDKSAKLNKTAEVIRKASNSLKLMRVSNNVKKVANVLLTIPSKLSTFGVKIAASPRTLNTLNRLENVPAGIGSLARNLKIVAELAQKNPAGAKKLIEGLTKFYITSFAASNRDVIIDSFSENLGLNRKQAESLFNNLSKGKSGLEKASSELGQISGANLAVAPIVISPDLVTAITAKLDEKSEISPDLVGDMTTLVIAYAVPMATCGVAAYQWVKIINKANKKHNFVALTNSIAASTLRTSNYLNENGYFDSDEELKDVFLKFEVYNSKISPANIDKLIKYYSYINPHMIYSFNRMVQDDKLKTSIFHDLLNKNALLDDMNEMIMESIIKSEELAIPLTLAVYESMYAKLSAEEKIELESIDFLNLYESQN